MKLSKRVKNIQESATLKLNDKATKLKSENKVVHNLTAGQLPVKPMNEFQDKIVSNINFLKSFQYSPVQGVAALREKILKFSFEQREVECPTDFDCFIGNGAKNVIFNILSCLINKGDEVVLFKPYWVSYPEMVKFWDGEPVYINSKSYESFIPHIEDLEEVVSDKTKVIILNSPNNPSGVFYPEDWMKKFSIFLKKHPHITVVSDEIYSMINYFDPKPTYFYQFDETLLRQTIIVDGISKTLASTGLRIGYCMANEEMIKAMSKIQGQTASGANSLIQNSLVDFDFHLIDKFLLPIKKHLRANVSFLRDAFRSQGLGKAWYQSNSAFYYFIDLSLTPCFKNFDSSSEDISNEICNDLLEKTGIMIVPGSAFGMDTCARMSIVAEEEHFKMVINSLVSYLNS